MSTGHNNEAIYSLCRKQKELWGGCVELCGKILKAVTFQRGSSLYRPCTTLTSALYAHCGCTCLRDWTCLAFFGMCMWRNTDIQHLCHKMCFFSTNIQYNLFKYLLPAGFFPLSALINALLPSVQPIGFFPPELLPSLSLLCANKSLLKSFICLLFQLPQHFLCTHHLTHFYLSSLFLSQYIIYIFTNWGGMEVGKLYSLALECSRSITDLLKNGVINLSEADRSALHPPLP